MVEENQNVPDMIQYDIINRDMDKREYKITIGIRSYWITKEELEKYLKERRKPGIELVALRNGELFLPTQCQEIVHRNVIEDSEKIETGRWQCDNGEWHRVGATCYCNVTMIADEETRTMRLEERKPGQLPATATEENREPPVSQSRKDTFSYAHGAAIKTF